DHLIRWQIVVGVDRTVVCVIGSWVVAPSRDPVSPIPSIPSTVYENDAVVMVPPPVPLGPLGRIVPENFIFGALPGLAPIKGSVLWKRSTSDARGTRVGRGMQFLALVSIRV